MFNIFNKRMKKEEISIDYRSNNGEKIVSNFVDLINFHSHKKNIIFACIGTDRCIGDALAPLVGTRLEELGYNVIGTIDNPLHAENLSRRLHNETNSNDLIIAIDACLGNKDDIGAIRIKNKPLRPGAALGKDLGEVGDISIYGIVNIGGYMEYVVLQNTRLSVVMNMAKSITNLIVMAYPLELLKEVACV